MPAQPQSILWRLWRGGVFQWAGVGAGQWMRATQGRIFLFLGFVLCLPAVLCTAPEPAAAVGSAAECPHAASTHPSHLLDFVTAASPRASQWRPFLLALRLLAPRNNLHSLIALPALGRFPELLCHLLCLVAWNLRALTTCPNHEATGKSPSLITRCRRPIGTGRPNSTFLPRRYVRHPIGATDELFCTTQPVSRSGSSCHLASIMSGVVEPRGSVRCIVSCTRRCLCRSPCLGHERQILQSKVIRFGKRASVPRPVSVPRLGSLGALPAAPPPRC